MASAAINNFTGAEIVNGELVVSGNTLDLDGDKLGLGKGASIEVIIISANDSEKHCLPVVDDPSSTVWAAVSPEDDHRFKSGDEIFAVGAAHSDLVPILQRWINPLTIK